MEVGRTGCAVERSRFDSFCLIDAVKVQFRQYVLLHNARSKDCIFPYLIGCIGNNRRAE